MRVRMMTMKGTKRRTIMGRPLLLLIQTKQRMSYRMVMKMTTVRATRTAGMERVIVMVRGR